MSKNDIFELEARLEAFEVPAKRFGAFKADLSVKLLDSGLSALRPFKLLRKERPDLCVIGARPGNGKTSLLVQLLRSVARSGAGHTMMFSLEMSGTQLVERALAMEADIAIDDLYRLSEARLEAAQMSISKEHFFVDDTSGMDINLLRSRAMDYHKRSPLALVGVDYLQIIAAEGGSPRERVANAAAGLKQLAKDINAPVIALAQMSRAIEQRQALSKGARPVMSDLQECALVENWADQITFLDGAGKRDPSRRGQVDGYVVKNRHGQVGDFILGFDGAKTKFFDFEESI